MIELVITKYPPCGQKRGIIMNAEELRDKYKDRYMLTDVVCTYCVDVFGKRSSCSCPKCGVKIFDTDENGYAVLIDPKNADKSRKYSVTEVSGGEDRVSRYYEGELVSVSVPALTDCNMHVTADGTELSLTSGGDGLLKADFLMPPHDVRVEIRAVNSMGSSGTMNTGMGGFGSMGMKTR